jgi:hypothetical protein
VIRETIDLPMEDIARLCRRYDVRELAIFGSASRDDFGPDSDVDFLVTFEGNDCGPWMSKLTELEEEISALLQREVDVVHKRGIEQSRNWIRRKAILDSARVVYAA